MSWGHRLLDPENFAEQEQAIAKQANPWGPLLDLPTDAAEAPEPEPTVPVTEASQLSVASIEERLKADPTWWPEALTAEVSREQPRKTALKLILTVAEDNGADPVTLEQAHAVLDAL